ncbi:MAG: hypothetical protein HZC51_09525 [Nitrospirae bacterium]|nr:hypothetical protein [Nitrospirota bacterium]
MRFIHTAILALSLTVLAAVPAFADGQSFNGTLLDILHSKGVIDDASYNQVKDAQARGDMGANQMLADILFNKGVIDEASYKMLSAKAADEKAALNTAMNTAPQSTAVAPKPADDRPMAEVLAAAEDGFARLTGDKVKMKIGSWMQFGWLSDDLGNSTYFPGVANGASATSANQFYARYARLYFNGKLDDKIGFRVMFDAAPTSATVFRDAFVYFDHIPYAKVTLGQYLTPFGDEVWRAPMDVPTINYSMASTFIQIPTSRSLGVMLSGKYAAKTESGRPYSVGYGLSAINGAVAAGTTAGTDDNDYKDVMGRVYVTPFVEGLSVGGSFYTGQTRHVLAGLEAKRAHQRWATEFDYAPSFAKGLTLRGEYMWQKRFFTNGGMNRYADAKGWYATGAYRISGLEGSAKFLNGLEPVIRYEEFDEDTTIPDNERDKATLGFNYYFNKYTRLMVNYEMVEAGRKLNNFTLQGSDNSNFDHNTLTTAVQVWF